MNLAANVVCLPKYLPRQIKQKSSCSLFCKSQASVKVFSECRYRSSLELHFIIIPYRGKACGCQVLRDTYLMKSSSIFLRLSLLVSINACILYYSGIRRRRRR